MHYLSRGWRSIPETIYFLVQVQRKGNFFPRVGRLQIRGSSLLQGPLNPRVHLLMTQSSIDRGNTVRCSGLVRTSPRGGRGGVGAWFVLGRGGGFDRFPSSRRPNHGAGGGRPHTVRSFHWAVATTGNFLCPPARRRCNRGMRPLRGWSPHT